MKKLTECAAILVLTAACCNIAPAIVTAAEDNPLDGVRVGTNIYINYREGEVADEPVSDISVTRAYLDLRFDIAPYLEGRITPDVYIDDDGNELRLKYAYGKLRGHGVGLINEPWLEFGIVHVPWLDWEEHVNVYRVRGKMFIENEHTFNSADYGVTFGFLLGDKLGEDYRKRVNSKYAGRYGSVAIGVYMGGGYYAAGEENRSKVYEGRVTLRPLPDVLPGLQLSYLGIDGFGNTKYEPRWCAHLGMVSYEHERFVLTGQYYAGLGNQKGEAIKPGGWRRANDPLDRKGWSVFLDLKSPELNTSVFGRYDWFDPDTETDIDEHNRYIAGVAYHLPRGNKIVLDYERVHYEARGRKDDHIIQLSSQIAYH